MNCPVCSLPLQMTDRSGVEIDYCQKCRGVWLDRGELDKIIERASHAQPGQPHPVDHPVQPRDRENGYRGREEDYPNYSHGKKRKKESFLGDLFDF